MTASRLLSDMQAQLLDSLFGTERGLTASSEVRAEISELISQLEAKNPTQSPNMVRNSVPISAEQSQLNSSADWYCPQTWYRTVHPYQLNHCNLIAPQRDGVARKPSRIRLLCNKCLTVFLFALCSQ